MTMKRTPLTHWLLLTALLLGSHAVQATKLYQWTDEAGTVHYSEKPPGDSDSVIVEEKTPAAPQAEPPAPVETPQTTTPESHSVAEQCQALYEELQRYDGDEALIDEEGQPVVISPEMREAKISEIKEQLDQLCR